MALKTITGKFQSKGYRARQMINDVTDLFLFISQHIVRQFGKQCDVGDNKCTYPHSRQNCFAPAFLEPQCLLYRGRERKEEKKI